MNWALVFNVAAGVALGILGLVVVLGVLFGLFAALGLTVSWLDERKRLRWERHLTKFRKERGLDP